MGRLLQVRVLAVPVGGGGHTRVPLRRAVATFTLTHTQSTTIPDMASSTASTVDDTCTRSTTKAISTAVELSIALRSSPNSAALQCCPHPSQCRRRRSCPPRLHPLRHGHTNCTTLHACDVHTSGGARSKRTSISRPSMLYPDKASAAAASSSDSKVTIP